MLRRVNFYWLQYTEVRHGRRLLSEGYCPVCIPEAVCCFLHDVMVTLERGCDVMAS